MDISKNPLIALVVDRRSGRVIDCERHTFGPYLSDMVERHDLTQFDIIVRTAHGTAVPETAPATDYEPGESEFNTSEREAPAEPVADADDDVPF